MSYYRELHGDVDGALSRDAGTPSRPGGSAEGTAYVETLIGDLELARGRIAAARDAYRERARRDSPGFPQALTGLARIDAAGGALRRAAARLRALDEPPAADDGADPAGGGRDARSARAGRAADLAAARVQHRLLRRSRTLPDAEAVLFEANHGSPARAVALGRRVWRLAPSIRSADALGWALTRAGQAGRRARVGAARPADGVGRSDVPAARAAWPRSARAGAREAERYLTAAVRGAAALSPGARRLLEEARS